MAGKPITRGSRRVAYALDALSKNTLADLLLDMVQAEIGDGADDESIVAAIQPRLETVARLRGDRPVSLTGLLKRYDDTEARYLTRNADVPY